MRLDRRVIALSIATVIIAVSSIVLTVNQLANASYQLEWAEGIDPSDGYVGLATKPVESVPLHVLIPTPKPKPQPQVAVVQNGDRFWRELDNCESPNGDTHRLYVGEFQFHPDTARRAGGSDLAAAKRWAARLHAEGTSPGSRAGWPVCWWVAKRKSGYAPY